MTDTEFEDAMKRAGIRWLYRDTSKKLVDYLDGENHKLMTFMKNKKVVVDHFRADHKHAVIVDHNGSGQHVMNMVARGLLLYSLATRIFTMSALSDLLEDYDRRRALTEECEDSEVLCVVQADTSEDETIDSKAMMRVEAFFREMISEGVSLVVHVENPIEKIRTFSKSFKQMIAVDAIHFHLNK